MGSCDMIVWFRQSSIRPRGKCGVYVVPPTFSRILAKISHAFVRIPTSPANIHQQNSALALGTFLTWLSYVMNRQSNALYRQESLLSMQSKIVHRVRVSKRELLSWKPKLNSTTSSKSIDFDELLKSHEIPYADC